MSDFVNIYVLGPCFLMKFICSSVALRGISISLRIESLERESAEFSVPFLYFISKSKCCKPKTDLSILAGDFAIRE